MSAQTPAHDRATPGSWLQLRNGVDNSGVSPGTLEATWSHKSKLPVRGIAVAEGMVVLGTESADAETNMPQGDQHGLLTAVDARTGAVLWSRLVPSWIHGDPLIYDGRVYVTCGRWPMVHEGGLLALDAKTGNTIWMYRAQSGMMPAAAIDSTASTIVTAGGDGQLITFSLRDGSPLNHMGMGAADGMSSPRVDADGVALVAGAATLRAYSTRNGQVNWTFRAPTGMKALGDVPVAMGEKLVFTTGTRHYDFMQAFHDLSFSDFSALIREALHREKLRGFRNWFHEQWLIALNRQTGRVVWRRPLGIGLSVPRNQSGTPVIANEHVLVSSPISQTVWSFSLKGGKAEWHRKLGAMHKGAATPVGDDVVLGDKSGKITLLGLRDGQPVGTCTTGGSFTVTAPVIVGKTLIAASRDGRVWAAPYDSVRSRALRGTNCF